MPSGSGGAGGRVRQAAFAGALTLLYLLCAVFGLQWAGVVGAGSPLWPAAGVGLILLLHGGVGLWPLIAVARLVAGYLTQPDFSLSTELLISGANALGPVAGVLALRWRGREPDLHSLNGVARFLGWGCGVLAVTTASAGAVITWASTGIEAGEAASVWIRWTGGSFAGAAIVAPLLQSWFTGGRLPTRLAELAHLAAVLAAVALLAALVFLPEQHVQLRTWHVFPVLIWAAIAFHVRGVSLSMLIVAALAIWGLQHGSGLFPTLTQDPVQQLAFLQQFLGITAATMLVLAGVSDERRAARRAEGARGRLAGIVNSAMDAIVTVDDQQRIVVFNPAAEKMFCLSEAEALGQPLDPLLPARARAAHGAQVGHFQQTGVTSRKMGDRLNAIWGRRSSGEEFPIEASISIAHAEGERFATAILRDVSARLAAEEARDLLAREVDHRAKNVLAVVKSIITLTKAETAERYRDAISGRITAMARAHSLLAEAHWSGSDLCELTRGELAAYQSKAAVSGPSINIAPEAVQPVAMVLHELATNAAKYGALSDPAGSLAVTWTLDRDHALTFTWSERGLRGVRAPAKEGFGSRMIRELVERQLFGAISFDWRDTGLAATVRLPASAHTTRKVSDVESVPPAPARRRERRAATPRRILVVEDEALVAMELNHVLSEQGWQVVGPAATLEEALALAEQELFDVALLDVNIHGRRSYPVADALSDRGIPHLFLTGYQIVEGDPGPKTAIILQKPVDPGALLKALDDVTA